MFHLLHGTAASFRKKRPTTEFSRYQYVVVLYFLCLTVALFYVQ